MGLSLCVCLCTDMWDIFMLAVWILTICKKGEMHTNQIYQSQNNDEKNLWWYLVKNNEDEHDQCKWFCASIHTGIII